MQNGNEDTFESFDSISSLDSVMLLPTPPPSMDQLEQELKAENEQSKDDESESSDFEDTYLVTSVKRSSSDAVPSDRPPIPLSPRPMTLGAGDKDRTDRENIPHRKPLLRKVSHVTCLQDIPENLTELTVKGLSDTLRLLHLKQAAEVCEKEMVDGSMFTELTEDDLKEDPFNLKGLHLRKAISLKDKAWRPIME